MGAEEADREGEVLHQLLVVDFDISAFSCDFVPVRATQILVLLG